MSRDVFSLQALVSGRITDAISGGSPRSIPGISVVHDGDGRAVEAAIARVSADGTFVIYGDPLRLPTGQALSLRLEGRADGYATESRIVALTAADATLTENTYPVRDGEITVRVLAGPARGEDIALSPLPVFLGGRVSEAEDPLHPIAGAQVRIIAPAAVGPVTTDADGFFTLGPAPIAAAVTVEVSAADRDTLTVEIRLDFTQPVNQGAFALEPS